MIVVTGATGHLGNVLVKRLIKDGYKVGLLVHNKSPKDIIGDIPYEIFQGDITDYKTLLPAFKKAEAVFHLAAKISISTGEYEELLRVNVGGTANVVKACKESGVKKLLYVSSIHACQETPQGLPITENVPETIDYVVGDYAKSKVLAYHKVMEGVKDGLDAVVVFPTGIIGPFDYRPSQIGQLVRDFLLGKPVRYIEGAYNFVDVRDVVSGMMQAFLKGRTGEGYLLGGSKVTVLELYEELQKINGTKAKLQKIPSKLAYYLSFAAEAFSKLAKKEPLFTPYSVRTLNSNSLISLEKARTELGYNPRPFSQTLEDEVTWFKGNIIDVL
jgi:dihydroflavonol-4-reductase